MAKDAGKSNVKILDQFHSALEHTFLWVEEADNPHIIEELMVRIESRFNTLKIVPLITFQQIKFLLIINPDVFSWDKYSISHIRCVFFTIIQQ